MWQRDLQEEFDVFYKIHHCSVGQVRRSLAEHSWTQLSLTPGFLPHKTCSSESSCPSRPGCPVLGTLHSIKQETSAETLDQKTSLQGSTYPMSSKKSSLCKERDLRRCPGSPTGAWGMNRRIDALSSVLLSRKLDSSDASCTRQQYQGSARLSALNT